MSVNRINEAESALLEAESTGHYDPYNKELVDIYGQLYKLYDKKGNLQKLALYQRKYITLKESVYSRELTNNLMRVEVEYRERENEARIASQQAVLTLKDNIISRQRLLNILAVAAGLLLMVLSYVLFRMNSSRKRASQILDKKVVQRTHELQVNYENLKAMVDESDLKLARAVSLISGSLATMQGPLSFMGAEYQDPRLRLDEVGTNVNTIVRIVEEMQRTRLRKM